HRSAGTSSRLRASISSLAYDARLPVTSCPTGGCRPTAVRGSVTLNGDEAPPKPGPRTPPDLARRHGAAVVDQRESRPSTASTIDPTASKGARRAPSMWYRSVRNSGEL